MQKSKDRHYFEKNNFFIQCCLSLTEHLPFKQPSLLQLGDSKKADKSVSNICV